MKRNPKPWAAMFVVKAWEMKFWAALLVLFILLAMVFGCDTNSMTEAAGAEGPRFTVERARHNSLDSDHLIYIITDTDTGVQYLFFYDFRGAGLTKLEPAPEKEAQP